MKRSLLVVAAALVTPAAGATGMDLHLLWDDRCLECHGHSADFARRVLSVSDGELQGLHHVHDLHRFLGNHYLADNEVDAIYNMLLAQTRTQARFKTECSGCHDVAAKFVRNSLELRDGEVYGRESGRPTRRFLEHHRELGPDDVEFYVELLTRLANEVYRP